MQPTQASELTSSRTRRTIRLLLALFAIGLLISGLTALPLAWGARLLLALAGPGTLLGDALPALSAWLATVGAGIAAADAHYPFLFYGTDWLAFGHVVIALAFIGPLRDPWRNRWVVEWGILACVLVVPWALLFGPLRGIPFFWQVIDTSFGFGGLVLLLPAYWLTRREANF